MTITASPKISAPHPTDIHNTSPALPQIESPPPPRQPSIAADVDVVGLAAGGNHPDTGSGSADSGPRRQPSAPHTACTPIRAGFICWPINWPARTRSSTPASRGETSAGAQRRLPELLRRFDPDIVIVELGANDGLRGYPLNLIRRNLSEIMRLCRQAGAQPIVTEMKIPPNYGARYSESFTRLFAQLAKRFAAPLIPFFLEDFATRPEMMQADGLHPLPITQPLIRDQVMAVLRPLLVPTAAKTKAKDTAL